METKREAIEFLNGMRYQFIDQKKLKTNSDLKVISAIGLVCGMAEDSLIQQQDIERLRGELESREWISVEDDSPHIGQKVLLSINGVVQEEIYTYDMADTNDHGGISHFWSRDDLDECPELQERDKWQPLPLEPKVSEVE